jgi:hypothetical protein
LKWIAKAKRKSPFTLQTVYCCQLSEVAVEDAGVTVGEEFHGGVWNPETWNGEVQNIRAVAPEAVTLLLQAIMSNRDGEDPPENVLIVEEPKKSNDGEGVS